MRNFLTKRFRLRTLVHRQFSIMQVIVSLVLAFAFLQAEIKWGNAMVAKALGTVDCIPRGGSSSDHLLEYEKLEIVSNFGTTSLKQLLAQGGEMAVDNSLYNRFIHCIWRNRGLLSANGDINYDLLEDLIKQAIESAVGTTGPDGNLSTMQASEITAGCKSIKGLTPGQRIAKVQNYIVSKLQPFAAI